jgi:hypothetical protein
MISEMDPYSCILAFLNWSCYYSLQVAPQLYSQGWVGPVSDPPFSESLVVLGIETGTSESESIN